MKINFHLLNACNYRCRHCFAHFETQRTLPIQDWKAITDNCLSDGRVDYINLAGGEPLLFQNLPELIRHIAGKGARCSVITNGSLLTPEWCKTMGPLLDIVGVSVDTFDPELAKTVGRTDRNGIALNLNFLTEMFRILRDCGCSIKINTVVSDLNCQERMIETIDRLSVSRWKILKMKLFQTNDFSNEGIGRDESAFERFLTANGMGSSILHLRANPGRAIHIRRCGLNVCTDIVAEPNLVNSYLIVDPRGELCRNDSVEGSYVSVGNLVREPFADCLGRLPWDNVLYESRY